MKAIKSLAMVNNLEVSGVIVRGNWEGDPSIPYGVNYFPDYIEDLEILDTKGRDITAKVRPWFREKCCEKLLGD